MTDYTAPLRDMRFILDRITPISGLTDLDAYRDIDPQMVHGVLEEFGRLMSEVWAPTNAVGDEQGSRLEDGRIVTPDGFEAAYEAYVEAGWPSVPFDPAYGGGGFPWLVGIVQQEMLNSANMALAMAPLLTQGAIDAIALHGTEEQREVYLTKMVSGEWTGTMNLTEPDAGSDVGALRTRAIRRDDGSYLITGQKIFITFGDHDFTDNIVHLVLARTPDAPAGTKGISCFIVPQYLVNEDGSLGERNDVQVVSIEDKMGIKASPTCVMAYGDASDGAVGYLIGEENAGMRYMFTMMNNARLGVGVEGLGVAERAYQAAAAYAKERKQGYAPGAARGEKSFIIEHPDVRRQLLTMHAYNDSMRLLAYKTAEQIDIARHHPDEAERQAADELVDILIPIVKSYSTDIAEVVTSLGISVHGGMGYIEETGVAQYYRDTKITQIYEGTNGIQAMDLVGRKLPMRAGGVYRDTVARFRATLDRVTEAGEALGPIGQQLARAIEALEEATAWILEEGLADPVQALSAATPYQRLFSLVAAGWLMAEQALAANDAITDDADDADVGRIKLVTARFFAEHLLPQVHGLVAPVKAGKTDLFALDADQF